MMRSKLFVPGSRPELFAKALTSAADAISIDLEDAVSPSRKAEARENTARFLAARSRQSDGKIVVVRVNAVHSDTFKEDVKAVALAGLDILNVPKVESADDIRLVAAALEDAEKANGVATPIKILATIETPKGLRHAADIAGASARMMGLQIGFADLLLPAAIDRTNPIATAYVRTAIRLAAAEGGIDAYDGAFTAVDDPVGCRAEADAARALGFAGKSCIHPRQIDIVNLAFAPTSAEVAHAVRVANAATAAEEVGKGAFLVDGNLADGPIITHARAVLAAAQATGAKTDSPTGRGGPLSGVVVLDLSAYIAGPYGATLLADMGADVIKIEAPGGDTLRTYPSTLAKESRAFLGVNRSKKGLALDLKRHEGRAILHRLVASADVLIHNFRPKAPKALGVDYNTVAALNPRLIYCALSGYGQNGPMKDRAGYDQVLQAMSGICAFQGMGEDAPKIVYGSVVDYYAASLLSSAVSAALYARERTGKGQAIDLSLLASALAMQSARLIFAEGEANEIDRDMRSGGVTGLYETRDGYLYISANTPHFWSALCEMTQLGHLATDERYDSVKKRAANGPALRQIIGAALMARSAAEWELLFSERVPSARVRSIAEIIEDEQTKASNLIATFSHPTLGSYRGMAPPIHFSKDSTPPPFPAPRFGQHADDILHNIGITDAEISALRKSGVVM